MATRQVTIDEWITLSLASGRKQASHFPWPAKSTFFAFAFLKGYRVDKSQPPEIRLHPNIACAEHYMFARWITSVLPAAAGIIAAMVVGYQLKKLIELVASNAAQIDVSIKAFGDDPATPPSAEQLFWGLRGVARGTIDAPFIGPIPNFPFVFALAQEIASLARDMGWANSAELQKLEQL